MDKCTFVYHTPSTPPTMDDLCYRLTGKSVEGFVADLLHNPTGKYGTLLRQITFVDKPNFKEAN